MSGPSSARPELRRLLRFGAVGLLNTALGYAVILAMLAQGRGDFAANLAGYAAGLASSFALNARWTFATADGFRRGTALRYALTFLGAYGANLAVLTLARRMGFVENPYVHLAAISVYSGLFYLGSARFVFVTPKRRPR